MDDTPQRANAAQMAARSIKSKPKGRAGARPAMGASQLSSGNSVPQFAPMPGEEAPAFGGGASAMFGGAIQAPSSFNFSAAGGPSLSFPPTNFGGSTFGGGGFASAESERIQDTRNPKRQFNGSTPAGDQVPTFAIPNTSTLFGGQTSSFGQGQSSTPAFNINGGSQSFPPTTTPGQSTSNPFSFGNTSSANASAVPARNFGGSNAISNPFNFNNSTSMSPALAAPSLFGNTTPAKPASTPFVFGQAATSSQALTSTTTTAPPATNGNNYNFGQTNSTTSAPGFALAATAPAVGTTSGNNFFGGLSSQPPSSTPSSFGNTTSQASTTGNIFGNLNSGAATPQAAPSSGGLFAGLNSTAAANPFKGFGNTQESSPVKSSVSFGKNDTEASPAPAGFATSEQNAKPSTFANSFSNVGRNLAASELPKNTPTKSLFGGPTQSTTEPANNMFASSNQNTPKPTNGFGTAEQTPAKAPGNNLFGALGQTPDKPTSNLFGAVSQPPTAAKTAPSNPFANLVPPPSPKPAAATIPESAKLASNIFNNSSVNTTPSKNIFGGTSSASEPNHEPLSTLNQPFDQPTSNLENHDRSKANANGFSMPKAQVSPSKPSSLHTPSNSSTPSAQSAANGHPPTPKSLSALIPHTPAVSSRLREVQSVGADSVDMTVDAPAEPDTPESFLQPAGHNSWVNIEGDPSTYPEKFPGLLWASKLPIERMEHLPDPSFTHEQRVEFYIAYRMRTLNQALQRYLSNIGVADNIFPAMAYYNSLRLQILQRTAPDLKRKAVDQCEEAQHQSKRTKPSQPASPTKQIAPSSTLKAIEAPNAAGSSHPSLNGNTSFMAPHQSSLSNSATATSPFKTSSLAPPEASPPKSTTPTSSPLKPTSTLAPPPLKFTPSTTSQPPSPVQPSTKGKRRGEDLTKGSYEDGENSSPLKRAKGNASTGANGTGSNTSSRFKNALNGPTKPLPGTKIPDNANAEEKPRPNPFASLLPPSASNPVAATPKFAFSAASPDPQISSPEPAFVAPASASASPALSSGISSAVPIPSSFVPKFTPSSTSASTLTPPKFSLPSGATTDFMSQFGAKASEDEVKKEKALLQSAIAQDYDSDDDETLEEFTANWKKKRAVELQELKEAASKKVGGFVLKASGPSSTGTSLFSKDAVSDNTSSQKSSPSVFKPSSGTTSSDKPNPFAVKPTSEATSAETGKDSPAKNVFASTAPSETKGLFGASTSFKPSGGSIFESVQSSRSQTPTFSFGASISQAISPKEPVAASSSNIFGHLSQQNSRAGSEKENSDEEEGPESDSENKDPSYKPGQESESKSGSITPTTPVEETGAGIASVKKAKNPFVFDSSTSTATAKPGGLFGATSSAATSTPRSLFDRIDKDENGNPIRELPPSSSEEKENTRPATPSVFGNSTFVNTNFSFGGLKKPAESPSDQTWKTDSPIKFGGAPSTTAAKTSTPAVNVHAATPTKPFGDLFGSIKAPTAGTSDAGTSKPSLFASLNSKPAAGVGFSFGGASGGSSLFPSAAASTSTSRATTPGATTDGDSAAESNDPDAEKHEQIDLTQGGRGEEDENNIHEVRAKALKYNNTPKTDAGPWETKGVGPMRVLQHKETKAVRLLLRGIPGGNIVLNKALLPGVKYEATQKTLKLMTAADDGKGLETWILQVKTAEMASELAQVLEDNKSASSSA